jgi:UDP-N-acetyl-D-mannosaminuronate dehydrogenase
MFNELKKKIENKKANIGIIGQGYVGLPLAVEFAKAGFKVTGFDNDENKVSSINKGESYILDVPAKDVKELVSSGKLKATTDTKLLNKMDAIIICVPTPLRKTKEPDISYILSASEAIAKNKRKGQLVILESTTYPGTTEEVILPKLDVDGLKVGKDFFLAFSPERVDPGNPKYKTKDITKIVGGVTPECTELARLLYSQAIKEVVPVSSTRSAEMVKLLENTFRSVNIAMVNELALMCHKMGLNVWEIIDAAKTKPFGFMPFYPGPGIGGHCLSEDEFLLIKDTKGLKLTRIGEIFAELKEAPEIKKMYYRDVLFIFPKDISTLSFDPNSRKLVFKNVHCLTERKYDGVSLEIKTTDNRSIKVTDKHPLFVQNGKLAVKLAKDLKPGEEMPLINNFPEKEIGNTPIEIDIIEYLASSNNPIKKKIRVESKSFSWKEYRNLITPLVKDKYKNYDDFYRCNQIPLDIYLEIKNSLKEVTAKELSLCTGRGPSQVRFPASILIDEDFCRLIGYYLSEGCVTVDKSTRTRFSFNRDEKEYIQDVENILNKMGLRYSEYHSKKWHTNCIKASSDIFGILIRDILSCGVNSHSMKIPEAFLGFPVNYRKNLLAGLLRGDGGVDYKCGKMSYRKNGKLYQHNSNSLSANYFSCSSVLFHQVIFLLQSLGIMPTFKVRKGLINISGLENIMKLKGLLAGRKDEKIDLYIKNKIRAPKSKIFKTYEGFVTSRIKSINKINLKKVYSLEVEDTNTFVSSYGIISHNCIPLDPLYLSWKARQHGFEARFIELADEINSYMPHYVMDKIISILSKKKKSLEGSNILIIGVTYKKDINDIRESPALEIVSSLIKKGAHVYCHDPLVSSFQIDGKKINTVKLTKENISISDLTVIITDHSGIDYKFILDNAGLVFDTRNALKNFRNAKNIIKL